MEDQQKSRRISVGVAAGISAAILAAGGGGAWLAWNSFQSSKTTTTPTTQVPTTQVPTTPQSSQTVEPTTAEPNTAQPATEEKVQVYWLDNVNNQIQLVPSSVSVKNADKPKEVLEGAFESLLSGPANEDVSTTIPQGTELRKISLEQDGVHVDLSEEFTFGGGSASMTGRLAQVLYTATSLDPKAKVWIDIEGEPLEVLGGEGLLIEQPMTRENFDQNFEL